MRYTPLLALAMGNMAMAQFTNSSTTTNTQSSTGTETAPTGTATGNPDRVGSFSFFGCVGSTDGFPTFAIETSSDEMDAELCAASCEGSQYFGLFTGDCYCGEELDAANSNILENGACDIPCPGNEDQTCGGTAPLRLARRQVPSTVYLTIYIRVAAESSSVVTQTVTGETVTVTAGTSVYTTVIAPAPTNIIIICFGDYCAPQVDCGCDTKWRVICEDDVCRPEECTDDEYWNRLVVCHDGECEYPTCSGADCDRKIVCTDGVCHYDTCHADECQKKLVCTDNNCHHAACSGDDCYKKEVCANGSCIVEPQCSTDCPAPPAPQPAPTGHEGPFTPSKPVETGSGSKSNGDEPVVVTGGSGKMIPAVGITAFGMVAGLAFLL